MHLDILPFINIKYVQSGKASCLMKNECVGAPCLLVRPEARIAAYGNQTSTAVWIRR